MNKYSDLSSRYLLSLASSSALTPKLLKSYQNTFDINNISIYRYKSDSPEIRNTHSPLHTKSNHFGISRFSLEHNQKASDSSDLPTPRKNVSIKLPEIQLKHSDFSSILDKIEKVVSPRTKFVNILLKDNESQRIVQSSNEYKFFRVLCKGKRSPMQFKIKLFEGKLTSYVSFTEIQPTSSSYDRAYNYTYFEVSEKSFNFKNECLYLGIKSHSYSIYKIKVNFGKVVTLSDLKKIKQTTIKDEFIEEESFVAEKEKGRNFIKENINYLSKSPEVRSSQDSWESKITKIKQKKNDIIQGKKQKAIEKLTRKERQHEENLKNIELVEKNKNLKKIVTFWIGLMVFQKTSYKIKENIRINRRIKLQHIKEVVKARIIQRNFRKRVKFPDGLHMLLIFNRSMQTYAKLCKPVIHKNISKKLVSAMSFSANRNELANSFQFYYKRIIMIQKHIRDFLETKDKRLFSLIQFWNRVVDKSLFSKKSKTSRRKTTVKYMTIPSNIRNELLLEFYKGKWKELRERVRLVISSLKPYRLVRKLIRGNVNLISFNYFPSESEMIKLINSSGKPDKD